MALKTYLVMYFGTKEVGVAEIARRVEDLGFKTTFGSVDFEYIWNKQPTKEEVFSLGDKLVKALKDTGAVFNLDTHD